MYSLVLEEIDLNSVHFRLPVNIDTTVVSEFPLRQDFDRTE